MKPFARKMNMKVHSRVLKETNEGIKSILEVHYLNTVKSKILFVSQLATNFFPSSAFTLSYTGSSSSPSTTTKALIASLEGGEGKVVRN